MTMHKTVHVSVDAMIEDLRTLVEIESPSRDLDALLASAKAALRR
jgi:glutamate carboxypeptidase